MMDDNRSVYERLNSIESNQSTAQVQNEEILKLLKSLSKDSEVNSNIVNQSYRQISKQQLLKNFIKSSKNEYLWHGKREEFSKYKTIVSLLYFDLIIIGIISTIITSVTFKLYSTFSLLENIWLIFAFIMFLYAVKTKRVISDFSLKKYSDIIFIRDAYGIFEKTNKKKKKIRFFEIITCIAVIGNIISIWIQGDGEIAISAIIFELIFLCLIIVSFYSYKKLFSMYDCFILITGKNTLNTKTVKFIFDIKENKFAPYEEYKEKLKDYF